MIGRGEELVALDHTTAKLLERVEGLHDELFYSINEKVDKAVNDVAYHLKKELLEVAMKRKEEALSQIKQQGHDLQKAKQEFEKAADSPKEKYAFDQWQRSADAIQKSIDGLQVVYQVDPKRAVSQLKTAINIDVTLPMAAAPDDED